MALYYLIVSLVLVLISPYLLISQKARAGIWQKLGFIPSGFYSSNNTKSIRLWFHAVSVGEFNAIYPVVTKLHDLYPEFEIFVSTTTKTGNKLAKESIGKWAHIFYFPFDLPIFIYPWLMTIKPSMVGIVETEIWPGFLTICEKENIPIILVNGRLSPKSFKSYSRFSFFIGNIIHKFEKLILQSELDASRFSALSKKNLPITVTGNIKFDGMKAISNETQESIRNSLNINRNDLVFVVGSTHEGEESVILSSLNSLKEKGCNIKTVIAPRHPERFNRVCQIIESYGLNPKRYSREEKFTSDKDVYVLDTIGKLSQFYSVASIAFVGGTLIKIGGHSIVEPCVYGIPVITGNYLYKTKSVADCLIDIGTLTVVSNANDLAQTIYKLACSSEARQLAGKPGQVWLANNQGATDKTVKIILDIIKTSYPEFQPRELAHEGNG